MVKLQLSAIIVNCTKGRAWRRLTDEVSRKYSHSRTQTETQTWLRLKLNARSMCAVKGTVGTVSGRAGLDAMLKMRRSLEWKFLKHIRRGV